MHPNQAFRSTQTAEALTFADGRGFGLLCLNGESAPLTAHLPFILEDERLLCHLVASNPIARLCRESSAPALMSVSGPDAYISPDWYGIDDQVPTWNYVAVNLSGTLMPLPQAELYHVLEKTSARFEGALAPKPAWVMDKMDQDALGRMMRQIRPFELRIESVESTYKLNQNKPEHARKAATEALEELGFKDMAALMRAAK